MKNCIENCHIFCVDSLGSYQKMSGRKKRNNALYIKYRFIEIKSRRHFKPPLLFSIHPHMKFLISVSFFLITEYDIVPIHVTKLS